MAGPLGSLAWAVESSSQLVWFGDGGFCNSSAKAEWPWGLCSSRVCLVSGGVGWQLWNRLHETQLSFPSINQNLYYRKVCVLNIILWVISLSDAKARQNH